MSHYLTNHPHGAYMVAASYDGKHVNLTLDSWPISVQLSKLDPVDARQLGLQLIAQADRCERAIADDQRVRDVALEATMAADEVTP